MYKYSPVKKIHIKNFRNIGEAIIDFNDSPIISLIGENEAGKTSVVKAFSVCALHATPRDQKDFIRDGTNAFGIIIELEDGTTVSRLKAPTANRYIVKKPDGTEWDTSKIDSGLPAAVQEVMGLIEEPETKEFLQIRTYEDQLLFVVTPASTNYKVMYDALKVDQLTRALKIGNKEVNSLKGEMDYNDSGISTLTSNLRGIRTYDISPLINIKARLSKEMAAVEKLQRAYNLLSSIKSKKMQIGSLNELFSTNVSEVSESEASKLFNISRLVDKISKLNNCTQKISIINTTEHVDLSHYNKLMELLNRKNRVQDVRNQLGTMVELQNIDTIDEMKLDHLIKTHNLAREVSLKKRSLSVVEPVGAELIQQTDFDVVIKAEQLMNRISRNKQLKETEVQIETFCKQMTDYLKSTGAAVELCPNCGESVVIDIEKYA